MSSGTLAGDARAAIVTGLSARANERVIEAQIESGAHLMSGEWKAFTAIGKSFAKHETVKHSSGEYVRDAVPPIRWRASTPASPVPSPASFIISARSMPTCISTRSASDGRIASSWGRPKMGSRYSLTKTDTLVAEEVLQWSSQGWKASVNFMLHL